MFLWFFFFIAGDIIYNVEFPLAAPDVIFGPEDENFHPFHDLGGEGGDLRLVKNSLTDWNNKDPARLLALIEELRYGIDFYLFQENTVQNIWLLLVNMIFFPSRDKYMSYQKKRVGEVDDDRLKFEISTILSREVIFLLNADPFFSRRGYSSFFLF